MTDAMSVASASLTTPAHDEASAQPDARSRRAPDRDTLDTVDDPFRRIS